MIINQIILLERSIVYNIIYGCPCELYKIAFFSEEIRKEIKEIKSQLSKKKKDKMKDLDKDNEPEESLISIDPLKQQYLENIKLYSSKKSEIPKKGRYYLTIKIHY